jgi:serine/threonine protein kinase
MTKKSNKFAPWKPCRGAFTSGGQGELYMVTHEAGTPPGEYVLKWLKNPKRQRRFEQELKSLVAVAGHPNIVRIIDPGAYVDDALRYYVMEKGGGSLADRATGDDFFSAPSALEIFSNVLSGVKALHDARIIHRDIKPENVILFGAVAKVGDTGLCLIIDDPRVTPTYEAVGPRFYMAPELEHGRNLEVDFRADLYSLGKLLFWLLSRGVSLPREKFTDNGYALERTLAPGLEVFNSIFQRTLTVSPRYRYPSIDNLISAFNTAVAEYEHHADTRLGHKLANARSFRTAFHRLRTDEKAAAIKRAELGFLHLSAEDLIFVAEHDPKWRNQKLIALLAKQVAATDVRLRSLAMTYAQSDDGVDALCNALGPKDLNRAMLETIILNGDDVAVARLVGRPASPFVEFEELIPAVLARFPPPSPPPSKLVATMAAFPRFRNHPSLVDVMVRATDDPDVDLTTTSLAVLALSRTKDPRASAALDRVLERKKTRSDELQALIQPLSISPLGLRKIRNLASDPALSDFDRRLFEVALRVGEQVHSAKSWTEDAED